MGAMPTIEKTFTKKRVGPRFSLLADAEIVLGDGTSIPTQLDEVSLRGCYLDTLEPIPVGTRFLLKIGEGRKAFLKLRVRTSYSSFQIGYDDGVGRGFEQLFKQHWRVVFPRVPR